jgi:UDP-N-acetylmuramoyl-L-alanyl-D-glutamate--2,6-diaminopimelate ligase
MTRAVVNASDPHADAVLAACAQGGMKAVRFAVEGSPGFETADLVAKNVVLGPRSCHFTLVDEAGEFAIALPLPGRHNVENALAAWGATTAMGVSREVAARALRNFTGVPGRLEAIDRGQSFTVLVDYAHTPDALARALIAVRETLAKDARLAVVFGCGGDRDRGKRSAMGEAAARGADLAIVTDDNPRNENPAVIRGEAMKGAEAAFASGAAPLGAQRPVEIAGRRRAIEHALAWARRGDAVLIAGKGHEGVQIVGHSSVPFDDRLEAARALDQMEKK